MESWLQQYAKHAGARHVVVTDINEYRLELARKMGAHAFVNVSKSDLKDVMKSIGIDEGFTVGFEMSGSPNGLTDLLKHSLNGAKIGLL